MAIPETVLKVYNAYQEGQLTSSKVVELIGALLEKGRDNEAYRLSRLVYARGLDEDKMRLSKLLLSHNKKEFVPWHYLEKLRFGPYF